MLPNGAMTGGAGGMTIVGAGAGANVASGSGATAGGGAMTAGGVSPGQINSCSPDGSIRGPCQLAQPAKEAAQKDRAMARKQIRLVNCQTISGQSMPGAQEVLIHSRCARVSRPRTRVDRRSPERKRTIAETFGQPRGSVRRPATTE
jgi:hypothetical protein